MFPEYCYDCMNRQQLPMNSMNYMQPMQGYYPMTQFSQIPMGVMPEQMQHEMGAQPFPQFPMMQPGMTAPQIPQFPMMQPDMTAQPMAPVEGGPTIGVEPGTPVETNINYTQAYLRTKIGQRVKIEFLIGTNMLIDREGTLLEVGVSYVVIREVETDDDLLCDIYSIKFVRFYY